MEDNTGSVHIQDKKEVSLKFTLGAAGAVGWCF